MHSNSARGPQRHNLRQPLNVISLTIANFRLRIEPKLEEPDAIYVNRKLERIEGELHRLAKMLDELEIGDPVRSDA
jgi:signal transduction histidine kinase